MSAQSCGLATSSGRYTHCVPARSLLYIMSMARILLVDDDVELVELLSDVLRGDGHEVQVAHNGAAGLVAIRSAAYPDVIVLDIEMPVLGGPAMVRQMKLHDIGEAHVPIVLCSAHHQLEQMARTMGTPYWLAKPYDLAQLRAMVDHALRKLRTSMSA